MAQPGAEARRRGQADGPRRGDVAASTYPGQADVVAKDFFISYTAANKAWASWIAYILEADGFAVTIREWDFRPGSNFAVEMDKALKQCPRMIAVLSPAYLKAPFPASEWTAAVVLADKPFLPELRFLHVRGRIEALAYQPTRLTSRRCAKGPV